MATATAQPGPPPMTGPALHHQVNNKLPSLDSATHDDSHVHVSQTNDDSRVPRGPVTATMNFYREPEDGSKPHNFVEKPTDGSPQRNFGDFDQSININDLRGHEDEVSLDKSAFAALQGYQHNPAIDWDDDESVKKHYYPQVEEILMKQTPGNPYKVVLFDHTVRRQNPNASRLPVNRCHIDQTPFSAKQRVGWHLPEAEAETVIKNGVRYRIINVWRPINGVVESQPLGVADSQTVPDSDMVSVEHRYPTRTGETAAVKYNPDHKWYYWSGMQESERLLLQCFDSAHPNNRVPHSAFVDPRNDANSKPRESIEVRALVFG